MNAEESESVKKSFFEAKDALEEALRDCKLTSKDRQFLSHVLETAYHMMKTDLAEEKLSESEVRYNLAELITDFAESAAEFEEVEINSRKKSHYALPSLDRMRLLIRTGDYTEDFPSAFYDNNGEKPESD